MGLTLTDAERITMPEYLALLHHHNLANSEEEAPPSIEEVEAGFLAMERMNAARIH